MMARFMTFVAIVGAAILAFYLGLVFAPELYAIRQAWAIGK